MDLVIMRKMDNKIFTVRKYVREGPATNTEHVWINDWYGHHIIGSDCEWAALNSWNAFQADKLTASLPSDADIFLEAVRVHENVKLFHFDRVSFQYGARWIRSLITGVELT